MNARGGQGQALLIDHLDSFTLNVADALYQSGFLVRIERLPPFGDTRRNLETFAPLVGQCDAVVLSPGPGHPDDYNTLWLKELLVQRHPELPVLGICLGLQTLLSWDGLDVSPLGSEQNPVVHGRVRPIGRKNVTLPAPFEHLPADSSMVFYNSLGVPLAALEQHELPWQCVASDDEAPFVTLAVHHTRPWMGVQFHPESFASKAGAEIFRSFASDCAKRRSQARRGVNTCSASSMLQHSSSSSSLGSFTNETT